MRLSRREDVAPYFAFLSDPAVSVWLEDACQAPLSYDRVQAFVLEPAWCRWAIESDGKFVGMTGLEDHDPNRGTARFFVVIGEPGLWGKGLGQAILRKVVDYGFGTLNLRKINSNYLAPNKASRIIHARMGFVEEGRLRRESWRREAWVDNILVSLLREEWVENAGIPATGD